MPLASAGGSKAQETPGFSPIIQLKPGGFYELNELYQLNDSITQ